MSLSAETGQTQAEDCEAQSQDQQAAAQRVPSRASSAGVTARRSVCVAKAAQALRLLTL